MSYRISKAPHVSTTLLQAVFLSLELTVSSTLEEGRVTSVTSQFK